MSSLPSHVAIIMDGNGRWAQARRRPRSRGHQAGVEAARTVVEAGVDMGLEALTLFAFSSENWRRPKGEVSRLLELFSRVLYKEVDAMEERGVRIRFVGERARFSDELRHGMERVEERTGGNEGLQLTVAMNYGGRWDVVRAAQMAAAEAASGRVAPEAICERWLSERLAMAHVPDPDLLIRTGGERRVSNFMLWQIAYAELYFTRCLWPDFDAAALAEACRWYASRERRFGGVDDPDSAVA